MLLYAVWIETHAAACNEPLSGDIKVFRSLV